MHPESHTQTLFYKHFKQVQVQFNCFEVNVAQHIYVTVKTVPNYCEVKMSQEYYVEGKKMSSNKCFSNNIFSKRKTRQDQTKQSQKFQSQNLNAKANCILGYADLNSTILCLTESVLFYILVIYLVHVNVRLAKNKTKQDRTPDTRAFISKYLENYIMCLSQIAFLWLESDRSLPAGSVLHDLCA